MFQFLIWVLILSSLDAASILDTNTVEYKKATTWLTIHIVPATWHDAALMCNLADGVLASPTTSAVVQAMKTTIADYKLSSGVFIGVTDLLSRGDYKSLDGAPIANISLDWAAGEPNNVDNSQRCLAVTGAGALADVSCYGVLPYFCRNDVRPSNSTFFTTTPHPSSCGHLFGYEWEPRTSSCYKIHTYALNFSRAWESCEAETGHLAIINSQTEFTVLQDIFKKNRDRMTSTEGTYGTYLGFLRNSTYYWMKAKNYNTTDPIPGSNEFVTIEGQPIGETLDGMWSLHQPDNQGNIEHCGSISGENYMLNDVNCDYEMAYICEFNP